MSGWREIETEASKEVRKKNPEVGLEIQEGLAREMRGRQRKLGHRHKGRCNWN